MPTLDDILNATTAGLPAIRARRAALERAVASCSAPAAFASALRRTTVALIAEVKRRSPSAGAINDTLDPESLAGAYAAGGAAAISVLTDAPFFGGSMADLAQVVAVVPTPVLRKDFILDEVQLLEAKAAGASAALLIVRALKQSDLVRLQGYATDIGLATLVETHTREEIDRALDAGAQVVGVNARDLDTFTIDTGQAWRLLQAVPAPLIAVAESGMATVADVTAAADAGADAVLIGSALARAGDARARAGELSGVMRRGR